MTMTSRLRKLIEAIELAGSDYCYYDEDVDDTVMYGSKEEMYEQIMQDDELHLLGSECVKKWIETWWDNFELFEKLKWTLFKV